jgi:hypothetical protein
MAQPGDLARTIGMVSSGLLSEGGIAVITRAAEDYRASALTDLAESLDRMAFDAEAGARGPLGTLRASVAAESYRLAARKARASVAASQAAPGACPFPELGKAAAL